ncbi:MAG TPA: hypothetical protein PLE45_08905 [Spirochaetota bacterium]|nr:hypothetical protein [Spirochaetota bacterium]HOL57839.1 hypothetical protein [Spirochaetota bacterium]HPP05430.1 hypothetical protein [Spirochaetota bacterium]
MFNEIFNIIKSIVKSELLFIIIDIIIASFMAISGIFLYNKSKRIPYLIFVLTSFMIYLNMIFRVLEALEIFILKEIFVYGIPLFYYLLNFSISLFFGIGFILLLLEKK